MKKILCFLSAILILLNTAVFARDYHFTDIHGHEYYAEPARVLFEQKIISGYDDGSFGASRSVTRAEMAAMVCRLVGAETLSQKYKGTTTALAKDVPAKHWASGYVSFAVENGFINGDGNGKFRPEDKVSYNEAYKMIVCAAGLGDTVNVVPGNWAAGYLEVAFEWGLNNNVLYNGGNYADRGDIAVMLYNAITNINIEKYTEQDNAPADSDDDYEEDAFDEWDKYEHYDENGNFITYNLTVTMTGCGGIRNTSGKYAPGSNVPLYVYPGTESGFIRWTTTAGKIIDPEDPTGILTMPDEDVVVCAEFAPAGVVVRDDASSSDNNYSQSSQSDYTSMEYEVVRLVNIEREKQGLPKLQLDEDLTEVARAHSRDMYERNFFNHTNPDGDSPFDRMHAYGITYRAAAENIAKGQSSPKDVMNSWMNSEGHRANILSKDLKYIGVGICKSDYGYIWTQCFTG